MADPDYDLLDDHLSISRTMDHRGKELLMAKNAYVEARRDGDLILAERERRVPGHLSGVAKMKLFRFPPKSIYFLTL